MNLWRAVPGSRFKNSYTHGYTRYTVHTRPVSAVGLVLQHRSHDEDEEDEEGVGIAMLVCVSQVQPEFAVAELVQNA